MCASGGRDNRCKFSVAMVDAVADWLGGGLERGFVGRPSDWAKMPWVPVHELLADLQRDSR